MRRFSAGEFVLKVLGLLLLTAAALKGYQLVTEPVAGRDIWSYRPLLVLLVECELALGLWLVSGLFPRIAWLAGLACFSFFSLVTLYKAVTGVASCGCFGSVRVNPWITLLAIDVPAVLALGVFCPPSLRARRVLLCLRLRRRRLQALMRQFTRPAPSGPRFAATAVLTLSALALTMPILALGDPARATPTYEVLEPQTWIGKELPILEHIDIGERLKTGDWLVVFYHHDCPDCQAAIPRYEQMATELEASGHPLRIALVEMPPYGQNALRSDTPCSYGRLDSSKKWFGTTPGAVLICNGQVVAAWQGKAPGFHAVIREVTQSERYRRKSNLSYRHRTGTGTL